MPRHDRNDEMMMRERSDWRERDYDMPRDHRGPGRMSERGAMFSRRPGEGRDSDFRDEIRGRDRMEGRRWRGRDEDRWFGSDDHNRGIPMDETKRLIASNKVEGTPVYDRHGDKLGSIHNFMVDKDRGEVVYAVLKHSSGFLGLGERYYPLEWDQLTYDRRLGGYHVRMDEEDLKNFGSFDSEGRYHRRHPGSDRDRF